MNKRMEKPNLRTMIKKDSTKKREKAKIRKRRWKNN